MVRPGARGRGHGRALENPPPLLESSNLPSASSLPSAGGRQRMSLLSADKKLTAKNMLMTKILFTVSKFFAVGQQTAKCPKADDKETSWAPQDPRDG